jgi:hypothetical protein
MGQRGFASPKGKEAHQTKKNHLRPAEGGEETKQEKFEKTDLSAGCTISEVKKAQHTSVCERFLTSEIVQDAPNMPFQSPSRP